MPCYDAERFETKTHMGLGPGESIEYTKHRVSLQGHPWPGCHPVSHNAVFNKSTLRLEDCNGSNGGPFRALSMVGKPQVGTVKCKTAPCKM